MNLINPSGSNYPKDTEKFAQHYYLMRNELIDMDRQRTLDVFKEYYVRIIIMIMYFNKKKTWILFGILRIWKKKSLKTFLDSIVKMGMYHESWQISRNAGTKRKIVFTEYWCLLKKKI